MVVTSSRSTDRTSNEILSMGPECVATPLAAVHLLCALHGQRQGTVDEARYSMKFGKHIMSPDEARVVE